MASATNVSGTALLETNHVLVGYVESDLHPNSTEIAALDNQICQ